MAQPTRTQATVTKILEILLKTSTPTSINHYSLIGAVRSDAQSDKAALYPLNYFGFHLQEGPPAERSFCSDTQRKFSKFSELPYMDGFYRANSFLPACRHQVSGQGRNCAVIWVALPLVWLGSLAIAYTAGRPLR